MVKSLIKPIQFYKSDIDQKRMPKQYVATGLYSNFH
jgi:hypothetical protein